MKIIVQNVIKANVKVNQEIIGSIGKGFLLFVGFGKNDDIQVIPKMIKKLLNLRIFSDENGKTNLSIGDVNGQILSISQFTLYGSLKDGNRPSFIDAKPSQEAILFYNKFNEFLEEQFGHIEKGEFGADMEVSLINDGPATYILDSEVLFR